MDEPVGQAVGAAEIAWEEARDGGARSKGRSDGTAVGRAGAAEIAWEEARDGGARSKGMIRVGRDVGRAVELQK